MRNILSITFLGFGILIGFLPSLIIIEFLRCSLLGLPLGEMEIEGEVIVYAVSIPIASIFLVTHLFLCAKEKRKIGFWILGIIWLLPVLAVIAYIQSIKGTRP